MGEIDKEGMEKSADMNRVAKVGPLEIRRNQREGSHTKKERRE